MRVVSITRHLLGVELVECAGDLVVELAGGVVQPGLRLDDADDDVAQARDALGEAAVVAGVVHRIEQPAQDQPRRGELVREGRILAESDHLGMAIRGHMTRLSSKRETRGIQGLYYSNAFWDEKWDIRGDGGRGTGGRQRPHPLPLSS
ncbi:MAG TPA: hypothetical protein DEU95_10790 [Chloroflexi bacterium]|nr:hypothetical protein [Chloroflexota bacterium]HCG30201.1 hypothetical protein [Chloroflexota bacterium]